MSDLSPDLAEYQVKDPEQALDDAVAAVRSYCGWVIAPATTETVAVWSPDGYTVILKTLQLTSITSLTQDGSVIGASSYTLDTNGVVRVVPGARFGTGSQITAVFTHGYADWPDDVKGVILALAQRQLADTRGLVPRVGGAGAQSVIMENYGAQLGDADKSKLNPYAISAGFA